MMRGPRVITKPAPSIFQRLFTVRRSVPLLAKTTAVWRRSDQCGGEKIAAARSGARCCVVRRGDDLRLATPEDEDGRKAVLNGGARSFTRGRCAPPPAAQINTLSSKITESRAWRCVDSFADGGRVDVHQRQAGVTHQARSDGYPKLLTYRRDLHDIPYLLTAFRNCTCCVVNPWAIWYYFCQLLGQRKLPEMEQIYYCKCPWATTYSHINIPVLLQQRPAERAER